MVKQVVHATVRAKFGQNQTLGDLLKNTGNAKIAETSPDDFWGTGLHLYDRNAMDVRFWSNQRGLMSDVYERVRSELRQHK